MPNHRINLNIPKLDAYYEQMMDEVYLTHHTYPTNLRHMPITAQTQAAMNEADSYARGSGKGSTHGGSGAKAVRLQYDPDFCNGLPRHK